MQSKVRMLHLGVVIFTLLTPAICHPPHTTLQCKFCEHVADPCHCTTYSHCKEGCVTEAFFKHGQYSYTFRCGEKHECSAQALIGKRQHDPVCRQCCFSNLCENKECLNIDIGDHEKPTHPPHNTHATLAPHNEHTPTTETTTHPPHNTHAPHPPHHDHTPTTETPTTPPTTHAPMTQHVQTTEATTPTSTTTTTLATTTEDSTCRDHETATFRCSDYDTFNFCTGSSPLAYSIAHNNCAKHCGLCNLSTTPALDIATATTIHHK